MSNYDDYFTGEDKPFAENLNDALLLSNVFDMTVPIELPTMFRDKQWINTNSARKAGVSIIQLDHFIEAFSIEEYHDEQENDFSVIVANANDIYFDIIVYPNFNSYGNLKKVYWEWDTEWTDDVITVDILTEDKTVLMRNISNNENLESVPYLRTLNKIVFRLTFSEPTALLKFGFVMGNKNQDRYGAEVGISDVNGLNENLTQINENISENYSELDNRLNSLSTVANTGEYGDLNNKPFMGYRYDGLDILNSAYGGSVPSDFNGSIVLFYNSLIGEWARLYFNCTLTANVTYIVYPSGFAIVNGLIFIVSAPNNVSVEFYNEKILVTSTTTQKARVTVDIMFVERR